ncbi:MAG TPA: hypothetical protein VJA40_04120 [archaeon]|nr:hypothetical protein [archaeon]
MAFCRSCGAPTVASGKVEKYKPEGVTCFNCKKNICKPCSKALEGMTVCKKCVNTAVLVPKKIEEPTPIVVPVLEESPQTGVTPEELWSEFLPVPELIAK